MAILHGTWMFQPEGNTLLLWGEVWRSLSQGLPQAQSHPYTMTAEELTEALSAQGLGLEKWGGSAAKWQSIAIACPSRCQESGHPIAPIYSSNPLSDVSEPIYLHSWQVEGYVLDPTAVVKFLSVLPLGAFQSSEQGISGELQIWAHLLRWSLDLLARGKFLPGLHLMETGGIAQWQTLLDSAVDQARLEKFAQHLPVVCRLPGGVEMNALPLPQEPESCILRVLSGLVDSQMRSHGGNLPIPVTATSLRDWLQSLSSPGNSVAASPLIERISTALNTWKAPVNDYLITPEVLEGETFVQLQRNLFRTCFILTPPEDGEDWRLNYGLQAINDPDFRIAADTIWSHPVQRAVIHGRVVEHPQESFLRGLGLASKLYPALEPSLQESCPKYCPLNPIQVYEFIRSSAWRLKDNGLGVVLPESLTPNESTSGRLGLNIRSSQAPDTSLGLQSLLNFEWQLAIGDRTLSKSEFDQLLAQRSPLVKVQGEWIALQPSEVKAAEALFSAKKDRISLSLEEVVRLSQGDSKLIEKLPVVNFQATGALEELLSTLNNNQTVQEIAPPETFKGQLRPYQARGAGWLYFLQKWGLGACLADDMGLGKTVQLVAFLLYLQEEERLRAPTLLVCPTSILGNWEREVKRFAPTLKTYIHHGDKRPKGKLFAATIRNKDLVITSYPLSYRDSQDLQGVNWQGLVLDEAQNIKNSQAKQSQAIRQIKAGFRIALTGTPVENRLGELWSILDFLNPGYLGTKDFFQRRFALPIERYGDGDSLKNLRSLVQPFILRRLKTDRKIIQDLPEKQEMNIFCGLSAEQASLYQQIVEESLREIEESEGIQRKGIILALLTKLKQICNHPAQFLKEKALKEAQRSGKLQRLLEMLEEIVSVGDRALVFTQFAEMGKLLQPYLNQKLGKETFFLYGSTRKNQREEMVERFQNDPNAPFVFILSLKAGGTGLNLTRANHVFHFDRWWNPAVENQATDRVFRIGQTRNVQVHKFICQGTLEERINAMIESKKELAQQVVSAGENWLTELDTNQLRDLLILDRNAIIDEDK